MKRLPDKMEAVSLPLVVEVFKLNGVFTEVVVGLFKAGDRNGALVYGPDPRNELAKVSVILVREDTVEDARTKAIDVEKQFPCLVTA